MKRKTPTEKQIAEMSFLEREDLIKKALECLHSLNRRAKEKRDRRNEYSRASFAKAITKEINTIYALKTLFLTLLVEQHEAKVYSWEVESDFGSVTCDCCGHAWVGHMGSWCFRCDDGDGVLDDPCETWYLVESHGYRFHQPEDSATDAMVKAARPLPDADAHDPHQEQREIPNVGLTIRAQLACVDMACEVVAGKLAVAS